MAKKESPSKTLFTQAHVMTKMHIEFSDDDRPYREVFGSMLSEGHRVIV